MSLKSHTSGVKVQSQCGQTESVCVTLYYTFRALYLTKLKSSCFPDNPDGVVGENHFHDSTNFHFQYEAKEKLDSQLRMEYGDVSQGY